MVHIEKLYFTLKEIAKRWQAEMDDLAYMAENGDLRVSVRLFTVRLEEGVYGTTPATANYPRIPFDQSWFSGLRDLTACDAHKVFHHGQAPVGCSSTRRATPMSRSSNLQRPSSFRLGSWWSGGRSATGSNGTGSRSRGRPPASRRS